MHRRQIADIFHSHVTLSTVRFYKSYLTAYGGHFFLQQPEPKLSSHIFYFSPCPRRSRPWPSSWSPGDACESADCVHVCQHAFHQTRCVVAVMCSVAVQTLIWVCILVTCFILTVAHVNLLWTCHSVGSSSAPSHKNDTYALRCTNCRLKCDGYCI